ncbi:MAG: phage exonuclease, partial [Thermoplasmata archaeon]|nr:phage exonuclease [Thermoplasmata archaeon]
MVSNDKDLMTIPGKLYRPMNDERLTITKVEADRFWMKQTLMGDKTDGYDGIPGVGPKTA